MKDFNNLNHFCDSSLVEKYDKTMNSKNLLENQKFDQKLKFDENGQNITLQVNGKEEEKYLINNSTKLNNKLSYSCLDLNELNLPNSTQLSLNSLSSETCIHAEAGKLFHKQLGKELNKVIPSMQKKMSCLESISNKFNKKEKYPPSHLTNLKQFDDNLENCFLINEPLISNNNNHYDQKNQFETNSNSTPTSNTTASSKLTNSKSIQSIFVGQSNFLKPPCSRATTASVAPSLNKIGNSIYPLSSCNKNRISFIDSSNLNIKTDLTPTNLRRRCIAKNGVANIRNAKISRKSQRFFLDFFNTMIDIEWHFNLLTFALSFVISWLFFAVIWWCIAYQHGDLYRIDEFEEVAVDLDKMDMNLNFLTENIENLNPQNVYGKTKRSTSAVIIEFEDQDQDEILNSLALSILNNRTTVQQLIEHFKLSKLKLNSTSGTNIYNKMYDGTNLTQFLSYAKNNANLKQTFALHNVSLNKIAKLVQPKRIFLNDSSTRLIELNEIKQLNDNGKATLTNSDLQLDQSLIMNTVTSNDEHFPQFPVANLTLDQRNQLENLFYLMQLQTLLQQERHKQQIAKFLTKLAQKNKHHGFQSKPLHPPLVPPPHPLPLHSSSAIEASEEQNQKELEAKQKEQEKKEQQRCKLEKQEKQKIINDLLNKQNQSLSLQLNSSYIMPDDREMKQNSVIDNLPSTDAVIDAAVQKASETVMPKCGVNGTKACRKTCLDNINSFTDAILFSIETQHTIGYGTRQPTDECKIVLIVLMIQSIFGCLIQCFVVGFVFAKLSRPQNRHQTLIFSKRALINLSEYDQMYDYLGDGHIENQFNLNFEELNDLVKLMKTGEMQDIIQDCGCNNSETSSNQNCNELRRSSDGALSNPDDDLIRLQNNNILDNFLDGSNGQKDLLNNFLNIPPGLSSKRCSNVSFLNTNLSSLRSNSINKPYANLGVNHCCELEQNIDYTGNKNYRLEFRIGDVREKSHIINAKISAYFLSKENYYFKNDLLPKSNKFMNQLFLRKRRSEMDYSNLKLNSTINTTKTYNYNELLMEKKLHNFTQKKLPLTIDNVEHSDGELLLIWPIVVSHEINERSPLYNVSREEMMNSKFEIVIVLEGTIESTGQSVQARTSYLPNEILWGEKFLPILQSDNEDSEFLVNFSMFNMTKSQNMPNFSSRDYQIRKKFHKLCILKKCLAKLSDTELDEQNSDINNLNNSNLLRHLISKNDKYNLNGLINNMDDLNNLNNLLITLNKLVNNNNNKNVNNFGNNFINNNVSSNYGNFNNSQNSNHLYQPSISIDHNDRKKSLEINQLYGFLNPQNKLKDNKSNNYLNNILISNQHDQLNKTKKDAEHITIEDDFLNSNSQERKKSTTLLGLNKLINLFHTNQSNNANDLEKNSEENKKKLDQVNENNLINTIDFDLKTKNMFYHKDDSYLNAKINSNIDWQFNSDWNLASAYRKRQFVKEKN